MGTHHIYDHSRPPEGRDLTGEQSTVSHHGGRFCMCSSIGMVSSSPLLKYTTRVRYNLPHCSCVLPTLYPVHHCLGIIVYCCVDLVIWIFPPPVSRAARLCRVQHGRASAVRLCCKSLLCCGERWYDSERSPRGRSGTKPT